MTESELIRAWKDVTLNEMSKMEKQLSAEQVAAYEAELSRQCQSTQPECPAATKLWHANADQRKRAMAAMLHPPEEGSK